MWIYCTKNSKPLFLREPTFHELCDFFYIKSFHDYIKSMKFAQKMQTSRIKCKVVSHILGVCVCVCVWCTRTGAATEREGGGRHHWCLCSQWTPRICGERKFWAPP